MRTWLLLSTLVLGTSILAQEGPPAKESAKPAAPAEQGQLKVPAGFKAAAGTKAEPYTNTGWAQEIVHEQTGMALVYVPAGEFLMGSPPDEKDRDKDETQHQVTLTKGFYLGKCEVTQAQWEAVTGYNPSDFKGRDNPVETVFWDDCQAFCRKLGAGFRLPTEAEWEYACRAGTKGPFHYGDSLDASQANFEGNYPYGNGRKGEYRERTTPVGSFKVNAWGLYDMHGNVWEWCNDWYGAYPNGAVTDPSGPEAGQHGVVRGGGWFSIARSCRSSDRDWFDPGSRYYHLGCRLAFSPLPGQ